MHGILVYLKADVVALPIRIRTSTADEIGYDTDFAENIPIAPGDDNEPDNAGIVAIAKSLQSKKSRDDDEDGSGDDDADDSGDDDEDDRGDDD
ncbi:hypothetical protein DL771_009367 [Monosporascus sp. 5C6A]|nr:hypothetical protein DL771_009367 [Monosporascus sp. 5C6A]